MRVTDTTVGMLCFGICVCAVLQACVFPSGTSATDSVPDAPSERYSGRSMLSPLNRVWDVRGGSMSGAVVRRDTVSELSAPAVLEESPPGRLSIRFDQLPARTFANVMSRLGGYNIVVAENVQDRPITINLHGVPWHQALHAAARAHQLAIYQEGGVIMLNDAAQRQSETTFQPPLRTDLFRLVHLQPEAVKEIIAPLFETGRDKPLFSVDERTRSLVVKSNPENADLIHALIRRLDVPVRQVQIEAFIVEANEDFERSFGARLGINYFGVDGLRVAGVAGAPPQDRLTLGNNSGAAVDLPVAGAPVGVGFLLDPVRLKVELTALEEAGKSRIVSNPKIVTLNNQEAVIFQGDEVPYFTVSESGTQTNFKEAGIRLAVTPTITGDNGLILNVSVNKDTVDTRIPNPPITRRQVSARLKVANNKVVVLGGIYFNTRVDTSRRVPIIGRLPVAGALFRNTLKGRGSKQLLVFISPRIIR